MFDLILFQKKNLQYIQPGPGFQVYIHTDLVGGLLNFCTISPCLLNVALFRGLLYLNVTFLDTFVVETPTVGKITAVEIRNRDFRDFCSFFRLFCLNTDSAHPDCLILDVKSR